MKIISVIPFKKGIPKGDLSYFTSLEVSAGDIVIVSIKSKKTLALVTSVEELRDKKSNVKEMDFNLKKVLENKGSSVFLKEYLETIFTTAKYFAQNKNHTAASLIPFIFVEKYDHLAKMITNQKENISDNHATIKSEKLLFQAPFGDRISIYKTLVRESFARNKSVFIILPTQSDIDKFKDHLSKGIEHFTFSLHGGMNPKKNLAACEKILSSKHPVLIIGTPPFLSMPMRDIGTIILEHESSNAYKMIGKYHLDLRVFVELYASKINARFILADEILRYETIGRKDIDNLIPLHPLSFRVDFLGEIKVLGKDEKFKVLHDESTEELESTILSKKKVFIFSLRKGLATMTVCRDCGNMISCQECGAPLVLYTSHQGKNRIFVCNRCQKDMDGDTVCSKCRSWNLIPLGIGVDTVYEEVKRLFPHEKIFKLDKESAKTAKGAEKIIKEFEESSSAVLVGTEMAFSYLKEKIPVSIVASFDSLWSIPNFKMSEKIIQILFSIINNTKKKVIIQTKNPNDRTLTAIKSGNLLSFAREELEDRKNLGYPPYKRFIKITHLGDKDQTIKARRLLEETFKEYSPEIFSGFIAKMQGKYMTNALIKIDPKKWSLPEISTNSSIDENLLTKLYSLQPTFEVFVDPEDLL
ncbi:MAG: hypothetical protein WA060_02335 [Minisyncoccia bacterium]